MITTIFRPTQQINESDPQPARQRSELPATNVCCWIYVLALVM